MQAEKRITTRLILFISIAATCGFTPKAFALFLPFRTAFPEWSPSKEDRPAEGNVRRDRAPVEILGQKERAELLEGLPPLQWVSTSVQEAMWEKMKEVHPVRAQVVAVEKAQARNVLSWELESLETLGKTFQEGFRRRDHYRERTYASPELRALLSEAIPVFRTEFPESTVMIGDVAQAGGGPLVYGTTTELLQDSPMEPQLSEFLLASRKEGNERIRDRIVFPRLSYPEEWQRWAETEGPVWVEERLTGVGSRESAVLGRIERRRFYRSDSLDSSELKDWWKKKIRRYRVGNLVQREWISTGNQRFYRVSWVDGRKQFVADFAAQFRGKPPLETLLRLRQATLEAKKPAALQKEKRYFVSETADGSPQIVSWTQLYEAGHISHQNGRDVDLSYVMTDDRLLFSRSVAQIDAPKSRRWLEILYEAGRRAGVEIDALLVDGRVRRHLMRGMPEQQALHPVWGLLKVVKGHDSHVHVRLAPGFFAGERNAGVLSE